MCKYIVTWDNLQIFTKMLASKIVFLKKWKKIIAITRGGLVPASILARELNIRNIDTICISSYHINKIKNIKVIKNSSSSKENILIVDDLVDTGRTLQLVRKMYPKAYFVTVFAKPCGIKFVDKYIIDVPQNIWIEQPWDMSLSYILPLNI